MEYMPERHNPHLTYEYNKYWCLFSGSMAGLAIGMVILGLIVAFALLMVYLKVSHKTTDDIAIQFKRHFDENEG